MKKLFVLFIALALLVGVSSEAFAAELGNPGELEIYVSTNSSGSVYQTALVSTSTIIPGKHKILGYSINHYNASAPSGELNVGLRDATTAALAVDTDLISENEVATAIDKTKLFPGNGKNISKGLVINQGPKSVVEIYYVRYAA